MSRLHVAFRENTARVGRSRNRWGSSFELSARWTPRDGELFALLGKLEPVLTLGQRGSPINGHQRQLAKLHRRLDLLPLWERHVFVFKWDAERRREESKRPPLNRGKQKGSKDDRLQGKFTWVRPKPT